MKILFKLLFTLAISITYFHLMLMVVVAFDIQPLVGIFLLGCTAIVSVSCYIWLTNLFCYLGILKRRFNLYIRHVIDHDVVYYNSGRSLVCKGYGDVNFYEYRCSGVSIFLDKDVANKYFIDPLDPTINELTMFELCGYNDCIQTFGEPYDYSKSFDGLFGYYIQQGFINKIKYIIKNRDRF